MFNRLRHFLLGRWAHLLSRRAWWVLAIALVGAVASIVYTARHLQFQPDRNDLISAAVPWNKDFIDWSKRFPGLDDLVVIVDAGPPRAQGGDEHRRRVLQLINDMGASLAAADHVRGAEWWYPQDQFSPKAIRLLSWEPFAATVGQLGESDLLLRSATFQQMIGGITSSLRQSENDPQGDKGDTGDVAIIAQIDSLTHLIQSLHQRFDAAASLPTGKNKGQDLGTLIETGGEGDRQYFTEDGRYYFLRVKPRKQADTLDEYAAAVSSVRAVVEQYRAKAGDIDIGLTGIPVIEADETAVATDDSTIASIVSTVLILLLLMVAFYSVRTPLLAVLALLIGVAWSFGYATLMVGHLQIISVVFTVMLLGLAIAYGIHLIARFELVRHRYPPGRGGFAATLRNTFEMVGPGVFTGAITTAAAFVTTMFTDFKGVGEMGHIAAVGVMLCLLSMFSVFPALLRVFRSKRHHVKSMQVRGFHFFQERWVKPFVRWPWTTLLVSAVLTGASFVAIFQMRFDFDLLALMPRNVPSVDWQNRLAETGQPIYFGVSVCKDLAEARSRAEVLRKLPTIADFGGIGRLFPSEEPRKIELLRQTGAKLQDALRLAKADATTGPDAQPPAGDVLVQFQALQVALSLSSGRQMPQPIRAALARLNTALSKINAMLTALPPGDRAARAKLVQREYADWRTRTARRIEAALDISPLTPADLPPALLTPYVDPLDGSVALEIYPDLTKKGTITGITSVLDPRFLPDYVNDMASVDEKVTGPSPQIYRSGVLIKEAYQFAGVLALVVVFVLVYIDFMRVGEALLTLLPVAVGFGLTFGVMYLAGIHINPANIIVLPLMFGIGVDSGVHMMYRFRMSPGQRPVGLSEGTGKGITINNLASVVGFASLLLARHRGVASLGFVLAVGLTLTTLACWTTMAALLELRQRRLDRRKAAA